MIPIGRCVGRLGKPLPNHRLKIRGGRLRVPTDSARHWHPASQQFSGCGIFTIGRTMKPGRRLAGITISGVSPYRTLPITDFYAYNGYLKTQQWRLFAEDGSYLSAYRSGENLSQFGGLEPSANSRMGDHWVGDLLLEADLETEAGEGTVVLQLIRAGVRYQCGIDLTSGKATLQILDGDEERSFSGDDGESTRSPFGQTSVRAGQRFRVRFSNYDNELLLWINNDAIVFDGPTTYNSLDYRTHQQDRPYWSADDPLDAAPLAIGVSGVGATMHHARVLRDKYYIAVPKMLRASDPFNDYMRQQGVDNSPRNVQRILSTPQLWDSTTLWGARRQQDYKLEADQYFPLGDNSPESADARGWTGAHFVPRDLLVGKAVFVFWPHPWYSPLPYTPNFRRMKLIH
ncbi:MAG: S26 family signal peptidase [Pirellulaceae bacterium]